MDRQWREMESGCEGPQTRHRGGHVGGPGRTQSGTVAPFCMGGLRDKAGRGRVEGARWWLNRECWIEDPQHVS